MSFRHQIVCPSCGSTSLTGTIKLYLPMHRGTVNIVAGTAIPDVVGCESCGESGRVSHFLDRGWELYIKDTNSALELTTKDGLSHEEILEEIANTPTEARYLIAELFRRINSN